MLRFSILIPSLITGRAVTLDRAPDDILELTTRTEAEAARGQLTTLAKLLAEMDGGLPPLSAKVEELLHTTYSTGQTPLTEVLRARARYDAAIGRNTATGGKAGK